MRTTVTFPLLLLTIHAVHGQLNYEGNPLTEDTVYAAEESHFAEKTSKARSLYRPKTEDSYLLAARLLKAERSQNLQSINNNGAKSDASLSSKTEASSAESSPTNSYKTLPNEVLEHTPAPANNAVFETQPSEIRYESHDQVYPVNAESPNPQLSESALALFLNSKTPQESRMALDEYLTSGQKAAETANASPSSPYQPHISDIVLPRQQSINADQQQNQIGQVDARYLQYASNSQPLMPIGSSDQASFAVNQQAVQNGIGSMLIRRPIPPYGRRSFSVRPPYRGPDYRAQSRVGAVSGYRKGSYGPGSDGLELIYTKPPGYGKGQYERGKNPYGDAGAWFPDANYPPPDMDVYRSQLYAQSYDPYYYNYIAKYGKIKPYLYGKLGKQKEESFLWELFSSFKKHGMKHIMNPMFLLGLGIPMVTLMLSALVNNRAFARSMSGINGIHVTDEEIDEWTTKLQKALDCHAQSESESERIKCAVSD